MTRITLDLTDGQVASLRGYECTDPTPLQAVLVAARDALPTLPIRLTIELPAEGAHDFRWAPNFRPGDRSTDGLWDFEAVVLNAVADAIRKRAKEAQPSDQGDHHAQ